MCISWVEPKRISEQTNNSSIAFILPWAKFIVADVNMLWMANCEKQLFLDSFKTASKNVKELVITSFLLFILFCFGLINESVL